MVPNHAVIHLALLWGKDDFHESLMIANTAGYDTDCNSANVGCLMGIKNGLAGIDGGPDWRGPDWRGQVADRLLLPAADGGRCVTDALTEAHRLVNIGLKLAGQKPLKPKGGARFHFEAPGAVQGFVARPNPIPRGRWSSETSPATAVAAGGAWPCGTPTSPPAGSPAPRRRRSSRRNRRRPPPTRSWRRRRSMPGRCWKRAYRRTKPTPPRSRAGSTSPFRRDLGRPYRFAVEVKGNRLEAWVGGELLLEATDANRLLDGGAIAIVCEDGRGTNGPVTVEPA